MNKIISKNKSKFIKIAKKYDLQVFILFGSQAINKFDENSDFDFAYFTKKPLTYEVKYELLKEIEEILNFKEIDLIELNTTPSILLRNEVFNETGTCLYESKNGLFDDLAGDAWIDYIDNKDYFDEYSSILKKAINKL